MRSRQYQLIQEPVPPLDCNKINYWDSSPNKLVEKVYYAQLKNLGSRYVKRTKTLFKCAKG